MAPLLIRLVGFLVFLYFVVAYGRFIDETLRRNDYWTYGLCLAVTFAIGLLMDYFKRRR